MSLTSIPYALVTLHRPANVDCRETFERIIRGLLDVSEQIPIIFPMHPRTRKQVNSFGFEDAFVFHQSHFIDYMRYFNHDSPKFQLDSPSINNQKEPETRLGRIHGLSSMRQKIHIVPPLGYLDFLNLMANAAVVLTDSGGIQEETTVLNVPCITLRETTERPITVTEGTNTLVHDDPQKMIVAVDNALNGKSPRGVCPSLWDGHTAERIVSILATK